MRPTTASRIGASKRSTSVFEEGEVMALIA
jgi:hypothetical protein